MLDVHNQNQSRALLLPSCVQPFVFEVWSAASVFHPCCRSFGGRTSLSRRLSLTLPSPNRFQALWGRQPIAHPFPRVLWLSFYSGAILVRYLWFAGAPQLHALRWVVLPPCWLREHGWGATWPGLRLSGSCPSASDIVHLSFLFLAAAEGLLHGFSQLCGRSILPQFVLRTLNQGGFLQYQIFEFICCLWLLLKVEHLIPSVGSSWLIF